MKDCTLRSFVSAGTLVVATLLWSAGPGRGGENESAAPPPSNARPTAALIALDSSPLAALFEARLIENPGATWLERAKIDEILREQKLTALLAPESGRQRADVGRLLKADVLVLSEQAAEPEPHVRLVVCETRQGLRLAVHQVVLSSDAEADVRQLTALADQALSNFGQEVREIVAVPPFVSNDLNYEREYLKGAYAKLAELAVSGRPGLLSVELEEAQAIGRELAIAGGKDLTARMLPLYLLGEFRHEGHGEKVTATIRIRVLRGEKELASREQKGLSPSDATKYVQWAADDLIVEAAGVQPQPPDAKLEAKQLAKRAEVFYHLGNWEEAVALAEAAVLLDNEHQQARKVAIASLSTLAWVRPRREFHDRMMRQARDPLPAPVSTQTLREGKLDAVARRGNTYLRALEHFEAILPALAPFEQRSESKSLAQILMDAPDWRSLQLSAPPYMPIAGKPEYIPEEEWQLEQELRKREYEIVMRMLRVSCRTRPDFAGWLIELATRNRPADERFEITVAAIREHQDLSIAEDLAQTLVKKGVWVPSNVRMPAEHADRYLEGLSAIENIGVRAAAYEALYRQFTGATTHLSERGPSEPWPESLETIGRPAGSKVLLSRIPVASERLRFEPIQSPNPWPRQLPVNRFWGARMPTTGWIPAGPGVDVILEARPSSRDSYSRLHLSTAPGQLRCDYSMDDDGTISDVAFDGRFVWIAVRIFDVWRKPQLMVLDPKTQRVFPITESDGLPVVNPGTIPAHAFPGSSVMLCVEPLEPGRVALVSWFGRLAIGTATFDPDKGADVDVFFEARHEPDKATPEPWRDVQMASEPRYVFALRGIGRDGKPLRRVLVEAAGRESHPLVVDPDLRKVDVLQDKSFNLQPSSNLHESDAVYRFVSHRNNGGHEYHLQRIGLPDLKLETLMTGIPLEVISTSFQIDHPLKFGDRFVMLEKRAWLLDPNAPPDARIQRLAVRLPGEKGYTAEYTLNFFPMPLSNEALDPLPNLDFDQILLSSHFGVVVKGRIDRQTAYFRLVLESDAGTP